jgi:hypothetical protein
MNGFFFQNAPGKATPFVMQELKKILMGEAGWLEPVKPEQFVCYLAEVVRFKQIISDQGSTPVKKFDSRSRVVMVTVRSDILFAQQKKDFFFGFEVENGILFAIQVTVQNRRRLNGFSAPYTHGIG